MPFEKLGKKGKILIGALLISILIVAALWLPGNQENKPHVEYPPDVDAGEPPVTISHNILAEMFISQNCENCTYSEEALHNLDTDEEKMVSIVHLVGAVDGAMERYNQTRNGTVFPDVEFDAGYRSLIGNATYRDYKNKTSECMTRTVPWVDIDVSIITTSTGYAAKITAGLPGGSMGGRLRVYLIEKESTDYKMYGGKSIHNLVIQYLYDRSVLLKTSEDTEVTIPVDYVENTDNLEVVAAFYTSNGQSVQVAVADFP